MAESIRIRRDGTVLVEGEPVGRVHDSPRAWTWSAPGADGHTLHHSKREAAEACARSHAGLARARIERSAVADAMRIPHSGAWRGVIETPRESGSAEVVWRCEHHYPRMERAVGCAQVALATSSSCGSQR